MTKDESFKNNGEPPHWEPHCNGDKKYKNKENEKVRCLVNNVCAKKKEHIRVLNSKKISAEKKLHYKLSEKR